MGGFFIYLSPINSFRYSVFSGVLTALCYPAPGLCFLAWFSLAPFIRAATSAADGRKAFLVGLTAGCVFHGVSLFWIYSTCRFAAVPVPAAVLAWTALSFFLALNWAFAAWLGRRLCAGLARGRHPWIWAASWTALAAASSWWTPRLGADLLAYTQYRHLSLIQIGSWAGPHGLGFLIVAINAAWAGLWGSEEAERADYAPTLALLFAAAAGNWIYGEWELIRRVTRPAGGLARVEILQPNVDQYQKWDESRQEEIKGRFQELLFSARAAKPDLILWPESALPWAVDLAVDVPWASEWGRKLGAAQVVGAVTRRGEKMFNSAILLDEKGSVAAVYDKRELVPFGEYIPLSWLKAFIGKLNELGGMTAGEPRQEFLKTPLGTAAGGICYEAVFPRISRDDARRGARLLLNLTNDGWYKDTWGPTQHFHTNVYRAVENRAVVIRAGNTGISGVIDPWGVVIARLGLGMTGRLDADLPREAAFPEGSFYSRWGDWLGVLCLAAISALFLGTRR